MNVERVNIEKKIARERESVRRSRTPVRASARERTSARERERENQCARARERKRYYCRPSGIDFVVVDCALLYLTAFREILDPHSSL